MIDVVAVTQARQVSTCQPKPQLSVIIKSSHLRLYLLGEAGPLHSSFDLISGSTNHFLNPFKVLFHLVVIESLTPS